MSYSNLKAHASFRIISFISTLTLGLFLSWTISSVAQHGRDTLVRITAWFGNEAYFSGFTRHEALEKLGKQIRAVGITETEGLTAGELNNCASLEFDNADLVPIRRETRGRVVAIVDAARIQGTAPNSYYLIVEWDTPQNRTLRSVVGRIAYKRFIVEE